jgi:hypothetical protein
MGRYLEIGVAVFAFIAAAFWFAPRLPAICQECLLIGIRFRLTTRISGS